jgi:glycosyltransferase involved in cell wall biosynthesis
VASPGTTRVLILSMDHVGQLMAGPGIRCWELARVLSRSCRVTLAAPTTGDLSPECWRLVPLTLGDASEIDPLLADADVVVAYGFLLADYPQLAQLDVPWVVDAYVPLSSESLASNQLADLPTRLARHNADTALLNRVLASADYVLCASERQRDLYLGLMASLGRLNPYTYDNDPTLRRLIDVVPFGLPADPPVQTHPALKGVHPGVAPDDKVLLWGGGIWDWFDPLTLISALACVVAMRADVRLYFPGPRTPFRRRIHAMDMYRRAVELCDRLGLTDRHVFFGDWLPVNERASYLLEADIGVSLHPAGIEARYAFRTRLLDYMWAGLPMIVSKGDVLADLVRENGLGFVVPPGDVDALADAILALLSEDQPKESRRARFQAVAPDLTWERCAEPLMAFCQEPRRAADRRAGYDVGGPLEQITAYYEGWRVMRAFKAVKGWQERLLGLLQR